MVQLTNTVSGEPLPCTLRIDGYLKGLLDDAHQLIKKNFDAIGIVTGEEGAGKTTLALQMALYMDPNFTNENIVFNAEGFENALNKLPKGSAIVWDEADDMGSNWASAMLQTLKKTFKRIRKNNFFILAVTPTFHDINKYFAIHRSRFLINVYAEFTTRGMFRLYGEHNKKMLYILGKKEMNMRAYKSSFFGNFSNYPEGFPIDFERYEREKDEATLKAIGAITRKADVRKDITLNLKAWLDKNKLPYNKHELAQLIGVSRRQIDRYLENEV